MNDIKNELDICECGNDKDVQDMLCPCCMNEHAEELHELQELEQDLPPSSDLDWDDHFDNDRECG